MYGKICVCTRNSEMHFCFILKQWKWTRLFLQSRKTSWLPQSWWRLESARQWIKTYSGREKMKMALDHRITEPAELEGTRVGHRVQLLALHRTIPNNHIMVAPYSPISSTKCQERRNALCKVSQRSVLTPFFVLTLFQMLNKSIKNKLWQILRPRLEGLTPFWHGHSHSQGFSWAVCRTLLPLLAEHMQHLHVTNLKLHLCLVFKITVSSFSGTYEGQVNPDYPRLSCCFFVSWL